MRGNAAQSTDSNNLAQSGEVVVKMKMTMTRSRAFMKAYSENVLNSAALAPTKNLFSVLFNPAWYGHAPNEADALGETGVISRTMRWTLERIVYPIFVDILQLKHFHVEKHIEFIFAPTGKHLELIMAVVEGVEEAEERLSRVESSEPSETKKKLRINLAYVHQQGHFNETLTKFQPNPHGYGDMAQYIEGFLVHVCYAFSKTKEVPPWANETHLEVASLTESYSYMGLDKVVSASLAQFFDKYKLEKEVFGSEEEDMEIATTSGADDDYQKNPDLTKRYMNMYMA